jgi:uncharacterized protein YbjT (DUF2867 family)
MRLESLVQGETPEARAELIALAESLRAEGYKVEVAHPGEPVHARLRKQAGIEQVETVLNVVLMDAEHVVFVVGAIKVVVEAWARARHHFGVRPDRDSAADIWSPDDRILERVLLPKSGDEDEDEE